jgi:hypothetical protein
VAKCVFNLKDATLADGAAIDVPQPEIGSVDTKEKGPAAA